MSMNILIMGLNWLGDSIMAMPAIESLRREHPDWRLTVAVKDKMAPLFRMLSAVDDVITVASGIGGSFATAELIKQGRFDRAYILPNSFRAALLPFLAGVKVRSGARGHFRRILLSDLCVPLSEREGLKHQSREYFDILGLGAAEMSWTPRLVIPGASLDKAAAMLPAGESPVVAMIPGAAFGPEKRWPAEYFCEAGRMLSSELGAKIAVFGAPSEKELCRLISEGIGGGVLNTAGSTSIEDMAALLARCHCGLSNDCGGMHMAAAMGVKLVAVFGMTDPEKTGPLGSGHRLVCAQCDQRSRALKKGSAEAMATMASVKPERVFAEVKSLLSEYGKTQG